MGNNSGSTRWTRTCAGIFTACVAMACSGSDSIGAGLDAGTRPDRADGAIPADNDARTRTDARADLDAGFGPVVPHLSNAGLREIEFDDLRPAGIRLSECWGGIGTDERGRVYAAFSHIGGDIEDDTVLFRYDSITGEKEYLGSLRGISEAAGNAQADETFAKVHVPFRQFEGKLYFTSHDFHGDERPSEVRGGHFYSFDPITDVFEDLSITEPDGISVPHQGLIASEILHTQRKLVGFTYPFGDVAVFDLESGRSQVFEGPAPYRGDLNVGRFVIVTPSGKVFLSYQRTGFRLWELDTNTGAMTESSESNTVTGSGGLTGTTTTRDGSTVYFVDLGGNLHAFDVGSETTTALGRVLPSDQEDRQIRRLGSIVLSMDETKIYTFPYRYRDGGPPTLYEYDIASGERRALREFPEYDDMTIKGVSTRDPAGKYYFCIHGDDLSARLLEVYDE